MLCLVSPSTSMILIAKLSQAELAGDFLISKLFLRCIEIVLLKLKCFQSDVIYFDKIIISITFLHFFR